MPETTLLPVPRCRPQASGQLQLWARFGGWLQGVDVFDATLFSLAANELELMDPQQRLLLEVSWEALHSAQGQANPTGAACAYAETSIYPARKMRTALTQQALRFTAACPSAGPTPAPTTAVFVGIQQMEYGGLAAAHGATLGAYSGEAAAGPGTSAAELACLGQPCNTQL